MDHKDTEASNGSEHGSSGHVGGSIVNPTPKRGLGKVGNIFAAGTALFSDGYANGVVSATNVFLSNVYPVEFNAGNRKRVYSSMAFAGTVVGQLTFGYLVDRTGRKAGMMLATAIVFVFTALAAGAYGAGGSISGMFQALSAYRFLTGIGIGAEYPAGSVACAENTEDPGIAKNAQQRWFALATNSAIDWGFVISAFVPLVVLWIFGDDHQRACWRISLGLGCVPAALVFIWRLKMHEPELYRKYAMAKRTKTPYWLIFKKYWFSFTGVALIWFIYDFIAYPFGVYSGTVVDVIIGADASIYQVLGWNVVINLFYIPGTMLGALALDYVKPKRMIIAMLIVQAVIGFIMSGLYDKLSQPQNIAAFAVVYGLFLSFGEAGPGNCIGLLASKSSPTGFRGQYYGLAAAIGKIGAFAGTWAFPALIADFPADSNRGITGPFYLGSGLAILAAIVALIFVRELDADSMHARDAEFVEYLAAHGYDVSAMGLHGEEASPIAKLAAPETADKDAPLEKAEAMQPQLAEKASN